jgi:hypothetical protein
MAFFAGSIGIARSCQFHRRGMQTEQSKLISRECHLPVARCSGEAISYRTHAIQYTASSRQSPIIEVPPERLDSRPPRSVKIYGGSKNADNEDNDWEAEA